MTDEEIRAEAIDRIARADYARWKVQYDKLADDLGDEPAPPYDDAPITGTGPKPTYRRAAVRNAADAVDALGDMLPIGEESRYLGRGRDRRTRYVTAWREVTE